jgi:pyruvate dehydrogenase E1 component beta subunit
MVQALNQALRQEMQYDPRVIIMGEDVGINGGVFRVTEGLWKDFGSDRVIDTPLAESGIVGSAVGLAINGMKPVCEIQFDGFTYQSFHQIKQHLTAMRQRSWGTYTTPVVVRFPCGGGVHALEHHSDSPEAFYVHCQGLKVVMPSGPADAKGLLISAIRDPDPVIFLEPKKLYRSFKEEVADEAYTIPLGQANIVRQGKHITIISWGSMLHLSIEANEKLAAMGIDAEIIDLRTLNPLDMPTIMASVKKTGRVVIVEEAPRTGSLGGEIACRIQEFGLLSLQAPVLRVAGFDTPFPQYALEDYYLPNTTRIIRTIKKVMEY